MLAELPEAEQAIAEQVLRGGVPAVRQAVEKQNEQAQAQGQPTIKPEALVSMAERLLPQLRTAEWRDRADAALANLDELDLRDLRSVVVAADTAARDDETKELANQLREGLNRRVEQEHQAWLAELAETLESGRTVRALRLSSRPPKAGAPLPADLAAKLTEAANAAFGPDVTQERWATVLDAVAYSPVRQSVQPASVPAEPSPELLAAVRKLANRIPAIAERFGVQAAEAPRRGKRGSPKPPPPPKPAAAETTAPAPEAPAEATPAPEAAAEIDPAALLQPVADAETPPAEAAVAADAQTQSVDAETPPAEAPVAEAPTEVAAEVDPAVAPVETSAVAAEVAEGVEDAIQHASEDAAPPTPGASEEDQSNTNA